MLNNRTDWPPSGGRRSSTAKESGGDPARLRYLGNAELLRRTRVLVGRQNELEADLIAHLAEIDRRRLASVKAYGSLFSYCVKVLGFSDGVAFNRIAVARAVNKHPAMLDALRSGRIHLTGLRLLAPHLTTENCAKVLSEASGLSKIGIEELVARLDPKPDKPTSLRKLPSDEADPKDEQDDTTGELPFGGAGSGHAGASDDSGAPGRAPGGGDTGSSESSGPSPSSGSNEPSAGTGGPNWTGGPGGAGPDDAGAPGNSGAATGSGDAGPQVGNGSGSGNSGADTGSGDAGPHAGNGSGPGRSRKRRRKRRPRIRALSEDRYLFQATIDGDLRNKLLEAQALLRHSIPDGDLVKVLGRAVNLLVETTLKEQYGVGRKPRKPRSAKRNGRKSNAGTAQSDPSPEKARPQRSGADVPTPRSETGSREAAAEGAVAPPSPSADPPSDPSEEASRNIPMAIRRAVYERDGGRCAYVDDDGKRCDETAFLQLHHLDGFTFVHVHEVDRIELRCRAHNQSEADEMFGRAFMDSCRRGERRAPRNDAAPPDSGGDRTPGPPT